MKVKELIKILQTEDENAEVIIGVNNNQTETYAVLDNVLPVEYDTLLNDLYNTPGRIDKRLLHKNISNCVYLDSYFGRIPNKEYDSGDDSNLDIKPYEVNGPDGDPYLIWKQNGFILKDNIWKWFGKEDIEGKEHFYEITYNDRNKYFSVMHNSDESAFGSTITLVDPGMHDIEHAIKILNVNKIILI